MLLLPIVDIQLTEKNEVLLIDNQGKKYIISLIDLLQQYQKHHTDITALLKKQQDAKLSFLYEVLIAYQKSPQVFSFHAGNGDIVWGDKIINYTYFQTIEPAKKPKHLNHIPISLPPKVIGRQVDVEKVKQLLDKDHALVIVNGIGGIGKTVLSHYYWQECQQHYTHLLWLKGEGNLDDTLLYDYDLHEGLGIAEEMKSHLEAIKQPQNQDAKKQALAFLYKSLKNVAPKALMLIDNATNENHLIVNQWRTTFSNFHILITSRETFDNVETYQLGYLSEIEAIELFYLYYDAKNILPHDDAIVAEIVQKVGYHTLTIQLLANTLKDNDELTLATLLEKLAEHLVYLELKKKVKIYANYIQSRDYIDSIIEFTFDLSRLKKHEYALHLLTQLSILPSYNLRAGDLKEMILYEASKDIDIEKQYSDNLKMLWKAGWIERHRDDNGYFYNCHAVIQEVTRKKQEPSMENCGGIVKNLNEIVFKGYKTNPLNGQKWLSYIETILNHLIEKNKEIITLYSNTGLIYDIIGNYQKALKYNLKVIEIREIILDKNHPDLATSYNNISITYEKLGYYQKALNCMLKNIEICECIFDEYHPHLAISYNNIVSVYEKLGDYKKALNYALKSIKINEKILDENHLNLATSYNNISIMYEKLGDYQKALNYVLKTIEIFEKILDRNHINLATSYNNVSIIYKNLRDYQKALNYSLKSIKIFEEILDENHPNIAISYNNIAIIYKNLGNYKIALKYDLSAIKINEKVLDKNHLSLATSYNNIAVIYQNLNDYSNALSNTLKAIEIFEKQLNKNHPSLASSYNNIAIIYRNLNNYEKSLLYHLKAIEIREKILDKYHPDLLISYNNITNTYLHLSDYEKSLSNGLKAIKISEKILDKYHPNLFISYKNIASTYAYLQSWEMAVNYEQKALMILLKTLQTKHLNIKNTVNTMKNILTEAINAEGREKYEEVLQWFQTECREYLQN